MSATGTVYLPRLRSELAQSSFLSGRASRRQRVGLQGHPGTGEMTGRRETETLHAGRDAEERLSAVSSEPALRKLRGHRSRLPAPTRPSGQHLRLCCPCRACPHRLTGLEPGGLAGAPPGSSACGQLGPGIPPPPPGPAVLPPRADTRPQHLSQSLGRAGGRACIRRRASQCFLNE